MCTSSYLFVFSTLSSTKGNFSSSLRADGFLGSKPRTRSRLLRALPLNPRCTMQGLCRCGHVNSSIWSLEAVGNSVVKLCGELYRFPLQVSFRLEFEFSRSVFLQHVRVILEARRCEPLIPFPVSVEKNLTFFLLQISNRTCRFF